MKPLLLLLLAAAPPPLLEGDMAHPDQISGAALAGTVLFVTADEGDRVELFEQTGPSTFRRREESFRPAPCESESDYEGLAIDRGHLYALGSHALKRPRVKPDKSWTKNRKRLERVEEATCTRTLVKVPLDPGTHRPAGDPVLIPVHPALANHPVLKPFTGVPGKENGLDLEGLAVRGGRVHLGARSPVLRDGWVPVITFDEDSPDRLEVLYVTLDGDGIRDLLAVEGGLILLTGPPTEEAGPARLLLWDGRDMLPGEGAPGGKLVELAELPPDPEATPEAMVLLEETVEKWRIVVLRDGAKLGRPELLEISRP